MVEVLHENLMQFPPCPGIPPPASVISSFSSFITLSILAFLVRIHPLIAPFALPGSMLVLAVSTLWPLLPAATIANWELVFRPPDFCSPNAPFAASVTVTHEVMTSNGKRNIVQDAACCRSSRKEQSWLDCTIFYKAPVDVVSLLLQL